MKKIKIALVVSIALNVALVSGFVLYRHYVRTSMFRFVAMQTEGEIHLLEKTLEDHYCPVKN